MSQFDLPSVIWFNGEIRPWHEATIHVWSELATRGVNVFEGIRCYKQRDGSLGMVSVERHLNRLFDSARLLRISSPYTFDQIMSGIVDLVRVLELDEHIYIRPTIYVEHGRYGDNEDDKTINGAYIAAFPVARSRNIIEGIKCCVSSWRRSSDLFLSPLIKSGIAYGVFRLPSIEARSRGYNEAILLNANDYVSESTGSTIFIVRRGEIITPPISAGILESITRSHIIALLSSKFKKSVIQRNIPRTELYLADEVFLVGTLSEVLPVISIDDQAIGNGQVGEITQSVSNEYIAICEGLKPDKLKWMANLPR